MGGNTVHKSISTTLAPAWTDLKINFKKSAGIARVRVETGTRNLLDTSRRCYC